MSPMDMEDELEYGNIRDKGEFLKGLQESYLATSACEVRGREF